ncbi:MAG: glycosyltransferase involved in cell wall biosynthesis [Halioglobus sp.]|jgi:glycosyltransferase involved in cell wall biosynthesis
MVATSYPRSEEDWQGLFIRRIADAMGENPDIRLSLWAPGGPRHADVDYSCSPDDSRWLDTLAEEGGLAHLLRKRPIFALFRAGGLLRRLRTLYRQKFEATDIYHINWLQNALPLYGLNAAAVITVLGSDFKLLKIPGMSWILRAVLKTNRCVLAPNAAWMEPELRRRFGDVAQIVPVNFGIDDSWYTVPYYCPGEANNWLIVVRVTEDKIGRLFEWGEGFFGDKQRLHLFGPNQEALDIPPWVDYHGPVTAQDLLDNWYPNCAGFITLSEHSEGRPQVLLETMAAGVPIIASGIPAHRDTIVQGEQGYLVETREEFLQALENIADESTHRQLSIYARRMSQHEYGNWGDCVKRYDQLFRSLE